MLTRSILKSHSLRHLLCATATAGMLLPSATMAAPATPATTATATAAVTDVAVSGEAIRGVLLDAAGQPVAGQTVTLATSRRVVAESITDAAGRYEVAAAGGTHYTLRVAGESLVVRTWDAAIAPPAARESLTLVQPTQTVRGQSCTGCDGGCDGCCPPAGGCGGISRGGVLLGGAGLIGAGVIGAIALSNADDADDAADEASDKTTDNMMRLETQRQSINETRVRVNTIQNEIDDADDFDDLQDSLGDLDDLDLITQSPS